MTWVEAGNAPLLLEPARAQGTRKNERYTGIITRPIFGWKRYQKLESEDNKPNLDRCDSIKKQHCWECARVYRFHCGKKMNDAIV